MIPKHIVVQAGGRGSRMGYLTRNRPKALVPVDNLPMLFHLFRTFPGASWQIIGDYRCDVLERYLEVFAKETYTVVDARGQKGTCAGLRQALCGVPEGEPFLLIWCDLLLPEHFALPEPDADYVGISGTFPCRWSFRDGRFTQERSERFGVAGLFFFRDKKSLADVPEEGEFVRWLSGKEMPFSPLPLCGVREYGLLSEWEAVQKPGCRPFNRITEKDGRIIKEPLDEQGRELAKREKAWYARMQEQHFPALPRIYATDPLQLERIPGKNVYLYPFQMDEKRRVLADIISALRRIHGLGGCPADPESFLYAWVGKTFERLSRIEHLLPLADRSEIVINGTACRNVYGREDELRKALSAYLPARFCLLHGDCTFSNILLREGKTPVFIDPRGYFGYTELYGDAAYDWVKLYYSVRGNYDQFNQKRFSLEIGQDGVRLQIASNGWEELEDAFFDLLSGEVSRRQIKLGHALTWLSLTTYAWEDYDSICGAFYNGLLLLQEAEEERE